MTENQKLKRKTRSSKEWKAKRLAEKRRAKNKDEITLKPLRKGWALHHEDLVAENYNNLDEDNFICVNNLTHRCIHFLYTYYKDDESILDRLEGELSKMKSLQI